MMIPKTKIRNQAPHIMDHIVIGLGCTAELCGSRMTCDPPPISSDEDWLVFASSEAKMDLLCTYLVQERFELESGQQYHSDPNTKTVGFLSYRRESLNLLVSADPIFIERHRIATHICKRLNLMEKQLRVMVFQAVLYGNVEFKSGAK